MMIRWNGDGTYIVWGILRSDGARSGMDMERVGAAWLLLYCTSHAYGTPL
jgi:hypothetical protein